MNIRATVARLVMTFDIKFAPGDAANGEGFEKATLDHFTLCPAELMMCFEKRR